MCRSSRPARLPPRRPHVVPGLVRQTLHVVGHVRGEIDDRGAEAVLGAEPPSANRASMKSAKIASVDLLEAHHRAGLVERPARRRASAPSATARTRRRRSRPAADPGRRREARARRCRRRTRRWPGTRRARSPSAACGPRRCGRAARTLRAATARCRARSGPPGRRRENAASPAGLGVEAQFGLAPRRSSSGAQRVSRADRRVGRDQRRRVGFEEADVRAGGGDRDLDGQDPLPRPARASRRGPATICRSGAARSGIPSGLPPGRGRAGRARLRGRRRRRR